MALTLVLFDDALEHLTRIHRVLRMNRGHALIVGLGGSGRQSLCRLASYAAGGDIFEIRLSRGYNENSFRDDLKALYYKLGMDNKMMIFLFADQHVAEEGQPFLKLRFTCVHQHYPCIAHINTHINIRTQTFIYKRSHTQFVSFIEALAYYIQLELLQYSCNLSERNVYKIKEMELHRVPGTSQQHADFWHGACALS